MRINRNDKKRIFRLFARGFSPEQAAGIFSDLSEQDGCFCPDIGACERLFEAYLLLPMGEKLRMTHMAGLVSNRLHRLMDDIADLQRLDILCENADRKTAVSLIDLKRKIKERMARDDKIEVDQAESYGEDIEREIERAYRDICGGSRAET